MVKKIENTPENIPENIPSPDVITAMSIQELREKLTELEIVFKKNLSFPELLNLLPKEFKVSAADRRKAFQEIMEKYKIQNPKKYASKEKELKAKLDAIK